MQQLNECYHTRKSAAFRLITKCSLNWGQESCYRIMNLLDLQFNPENTSDLQFSPEKCELITHPLFQNVLPYFWSGPLRIESISSKDNSFYSRPWLVSSLYFWCICQRMSNWVWHAFLTKTWVKTRICISSRLSNRNYI